MNLNKLSIVALILIAFSCDNDIFNKEDKKRDSVRAGEKLNALVYTNKPSPDVTAKDGIHETKIDFSTGAVENTNDLSFIAYEDTTYVENSKVALKFVKGLKIEQIDSLPYDVFVASDTSEVKVYSEHEYINYYQQKWYPIKYKNPKILTEYKIEFDPQKETISGSWNKQEEKYIGIMAVTKEKTTIGWIKISVSDYDNFTYFNSAVYKFGE